MSKPNTTAVTYSIENGFLTTVASESESSESFEALAMNTFGTDNRPAQFTKDSACSAPSRQVSANVVLLALLLLVLSPILIVLIAVLFVVSSLGNWISGRSSVGTFFHFKSTDFNQEVKDAIVNGIGHYQPPWWYSNHLGTLIPFGRSPQLSYQREVMTHPDGSQFAVDWYPISPSTHLQAQATRDNVEDVKIALYFPGLGLSSDANVAQYFALTMHRAGFICGVVTPRGHPQAGMPLANAKFWHPGCSDDAKLVLQSLHTLYSGHKGTPLKAKVFLSGKSASSNIILKTLVSMSQAQSQSQTQTQIQTQTRSQTLRRRTSKANITERIDYFDRNSPVEVIGAFACCIGYEYSTSRNQLESTIVGSIYSRLLVWQHKMTLEANSQIHHLIPSEQLSTLRSALFLSEYDQVAYPLFGYDSPSDMSRDYSARENIQRVPVPFLAMQPRDDPLYVWSSGSPRASLDLDVYTSNENVVYVEPSHGSHFGFYEGPLRQAFSNSSSYSYPAKVAALFAQMILDRRAV